jgi:tetraacyldisaccharide 4'-kinase
LWHVAEARARRLLRILLVWLDAVPAGAGSIGLLRRRAVIPEESELLEIWYGDRTPPILLRLLEPVYATILWLRRALYRTGLLTRARAAVPVIVVGNVTAGGTGKTPLTIALVKALRARGLKPGVVSRGYGGSAREPTQVDAQSEPAVAGDEACLIARASRAPVAVGRKRVDAARLLTASSGVDVLIADDGLQHYGLWRDVEICVIDGERRFGNGRLLPAGPLREPESRARESDFVVCNGGAPADGEIAMVLAGDEAVALAATNRRCALTEFSGKRVHAIAGIGNPARFFAKLRGAGLDVIEHAFADHEVYTPDDIRFDDDFPVLMTEKDAVKCAAFADPRHWFVPVQARLPEAFFDAVAARIGGLKTGAQHAE